MASSNAPHPDDKTMEKLHGLCPPNAECPCASAMGNRLLRELLTAMGWNVPARPEAPRLVWAEALRRIEASRRWVIGHEG